MLILTITNVNTLKQYSWHESDDVGHTPKELQKLIDWQKIENNPIPTTITKNKEKILIVGAANVLLNGNKFEGSKELKDQDGIQYFDRYGVLESFRVSIHNAPQLMIKEEPLQISNVYCPSYNTKSGINFFAGFDNEPYFNLNQFAEYCYNESKKSGFHEEENFANPEKLSNYLMNLGEEIFELWGAYRKRKLNSPCDKADKMKENNIEILTSFEEELADIVIRSGDLAKAFGIDLEKAVRNKIKFNRTREYRNGNRIC